MVMPDHVCPFGVASLDLLVREGYHVDDRHLTTREAADALKRELDVTRPPRTFIG